MALGATSIQLGYKSRLTDTEDDGRRRRLVMGTGVLSTHTHTHETHTLQPPLMHRSV